VIDRPKERLVILYLTGAYGRDYNTPEGARADWHAGKDFRITGGPYCSVRDKALLFEKGFGAIVVLNRSTGRQVYAETLA
jgi:hypothetical protein